MHLSVGIIPLAKIDTDHADVSLMEPGRYVGCRVIEVSHRGQRMGSQGMSSVSIMRLYSLIYLSIKILISEEYSTTDLASPF